MYIIIILLQILILSIQDCGKTISSCKSNTTSNLEGQYIIDVVISGAVARRRRATSSVTGRWSSSSLRSRSSMNQLQNQTQ